MTYRAIAVQMLAAALALAACHTPQIGKVSTPQIGKVSTPQIGKFSSSTGVCSSKFDDTSSMATGLDLSAYQGQIDWEIIDKQNRHFVFIRAAHGTAKDDRFDQHWNNAADHCMLRGSYFFFNHSKDVDAQAELFAGIAKEANGELPPVIDVEGINARDSDRICSAADAAKSFASRLDRLLVTFTTNFGAEPIIYTSPGFWNCLQGEKNANNADLWIAHYTTASAPRLAKGWSTWRFWQFTESARVGEATVDTDRFNGSPAALLTYAQSSAN